MTTTWNGPVWEFSRISGAPVRVLVHGLTLRGTVIGVAASVVADEVGKPQHTVVLDQGAQETLVAENCRILSWGDASWKNLVAWHLLRAAAKHSSVKPSSGYISAQKALLTSTEATIDSSIENLPAVISFTTPGQLASYVQAIREELAATLPAFRKDEAKYACKLLAAGFGGDAEVYLATWPSAPAKN